MRGSGFGVLVLIFVALLLRSSALSVLDHRGIVIDVLAFATVVTALRRGETSGTVLGFALGLLADIDSGQWLGRNALCLSLVGYAVGRLGHTLVRGSTRTHLVMLALAAAVHQAWVIAFDLRSTTGWSYLLQRVLFAAAATAPVGAFALAVARRMHGRPLFPHGVIGSGTAS